MSKSIKLEVVTPDRLVMSEDVEYVGCPGILGEFGVLPSHIPFLSALGIGSLYYKLGGKRYFVFVAGGFAEVMPDKVTVLAEVAELPEAIDLYRVKKARDRAEQRLVAQKEEVDYARARAALQRAIARMQCRHSATEAGTCARP